MSNPASLKKFFLIVPVLNEAENMKALFASIKRLADELDQQFQLHVVLVDDGSTDDTVNLVRELSMGMRFTLTLLSHGRNLGPGQAFGTAFECIGPCLTDEDWVLTIEGDNTSRFELVRQMMRRSEEEYDVILASPYMYGGGIKNTSSVRLILSHVANAFVKEFLGIHGILTMSSFFRLYRGRIITALQKVYGKRILECAGYESMIELLLKLIYIEAAISEVPMVLDTSLRKGKSKMRVLKTMMRYLRIFLIKKRWEIRNTGNCSKR